jgi:2-oxopent-4-enoate/cis-2-oxohex-4-enoate hydratase
MDAKLISTLSEELFVALIERHTIEPLTARYPDLTIDDAYVIQQALIARRIAAGEKIIGKKIGVTSHAVMNMLGVDQPDFGMLTNTMWHRDGDSIDARTLLQPKAEAEIAFRLKRDLKGPGVTANDVLAATDCVMACFEIVDSRIRDWKIKIQDTVADNASCGVFVLSQTGVDPGQIDLLTCSMVMEKNGAVVATGNGAATMGSPLNAVAWLANAMGRQGVTLYAGEIVLSGALGAMVPVTAGDSLRMNIGGIGTCSISFV